MIPADDQLVRELSGEAAADHAWAIAFEYAQDAGLEDARAFADDYAAFLEDYNGELHYPDLPAPSPAEYTR